MKIDLPGWNFHLFQNSKFKFKCNKKLDQNVKRILYKMCKKYKLQNVDNGTWSVDTISVQLDVPGVGWWII